MQRGKNAVSSKFKVLCNVKQQSCELSIGYAVKL